MPSRVCLLAALGSVTLPLPAKPPRALQEPVASASNGRAPRSRPGHITSPMTLAAPIIAAWRSTRPRTNFHPPFPLSALGDTSPTRPSIRAEGAGHYWPQAIHPPVSNRPTSIMPSATVSTHTPSLFTHLFLPSSSLSLYQTSSRIFRLSGEESRLEVFLSVSTVPFNSLVSFPV